MIKYDLQFFGGRGGAGARNSKTAERGYPIFTDAQKALQWADENYYDELVRGEEVNLYVSGNAKTGYEYVIGLPEDRKKLPAGRRWRVSNPQ